jgi:hypothetical protein
MHVSTQTASGGDTPRRRLSLFQLQDGAITSLGLWDSMLTILLVLLVVISSRSEQWPSLTADVARLQVVFEAVLRHRLDRSEGHVSSARLVRQRGVRFFSCTESGRSKHVASQPCQIQNIS